jgi:hypothetical protein
LPPFGCVVADFRGEQPVSVGPQQKHEDFLAMFTTGELPFTIS